MSWIRGLQRRLERAISRNADLFLLWVSIIAILPLIPVDHILARQDLIPWLMCCLSVAVLLRGRNYGDGHHSSLRIQDSIVGWCMQRIAVVATPLILVYWFDLGMLLQFEGFSVSLPVNTDLKVIIQPILFSFGAIFFILLGSAHGKTAWHPQSSIPSWLIWLFGVFVMIGAVIAAGYIEHHYPAVHTDAFVLGVAFLSVGLITGRVRHHLQRRASGNKDGSPYRPKLFNYLFAFLGSACGLWLLSTIQEQLGLGGKVTFEQAFIPAAFVVAWAGVVWPKPIPIAMTCLLHEVMPAGGGDRSISDAASPFDQPPEGALRINPLRIKRIRATHPWLVEVKASRVKDMDDPIKPLWGRREPPLAFHVLGEASFELDPLTKQEQWDEITVRLKGSDDVSKLSGAAAVSRSLVVLKPFLRPGASRARRVRTYRWEQSVPAGTIQAVDASTEKLSLENGSIIILATEGVARAFEVEIGAPVFTLKQAVNFRPPQLEDYVKV